MKNLFCLLSLGGLTLILFSCSMLPPEVVESKCRNGNTEFQSWPCLSVSEAIRKAKGNAISNGVDLKEYELISTTYLVSDKEWWIEFNGIKKFPGNHFSILIDDESGKCKLLRGQ